MLTPKKSNNLKLTFAVGRDIHDKKPKTHVLSWSEFVAFLHEEAENGRNFDGNEDKDQYRSKKNRQYYISATVLAGAKLDDEGADRRSICWLDLDAVSMGVVLATRARLKRLGLSYVEYTTPGNKHWLKGEDTYSIRYAIPTDRPMYADEVWKVNTTLAYLLGLWDDADQTAYQRSRLMFVPHAESRIREHADKPLKVAEMLAHEWEPPEEKSERAILTEEELAKADENGKAIMAWCEDMALELMPSRRGYIIDCPNSANHSSDSDGTSTTAILLPTAKHPEVHFHCRHANCEMHGGINRHQHLALRMVGVPDYMLPTPHNISRAQIELALPMMDEEERDVQRAHENECAADDSAGVCSSEDLENEQTRPAFTQQDPIIEGLINFRSTWYTAGDSNIGKSFHVLGEMAAIAAGIPFAGKKVVRSHCFYFDAEAPEESRKRKQALQIKYGDPLDWLHVLDTAGLGIDITTPAGRKKVIRIINEKAGEDPVGLVTFDSLNATTALAVEAFDENNAADMGKVVMFLKEIARETGGSPGVIHHPAKSANGHGSRTARGSGALHAAVDAAFFIEQPDPEQRLQLNFHHEKARFGVRQSPRGFLLAKCKVPIEKSQSDLVDQHLTDRAAPDFSAELTGFEQRPFETAPRDETLYLIPVALAPFDGQAAKAVKAAIDGTRIPKECQALLDAFESLPNEFPEGVSRGLMDKDFKARATPQNCANKYKQAWERLTELGYLIPATDDRGREVAGQFWFRDWSCVKENLNDNRTLTATADDLS